MPDAGDPGAVGRGVPARGGPGGSGVYRSRRPAGHSGLGAGQRPSRIGDADTGRRVHCRGRITSYNVCYTKLLRPKIDSTPETVDEREFILRYGPSDQAADAGNDYSGEDEIDKIE